MSPLFQRAVEKARASIDKCAAGNPRSCELGNRCVCLRSALIAALKEIREPEPRMLAAALPLIQLPSSEDWARAREAMALLPPVDEARASDGRQAAADLSRDFTAMIDSLLPQSRDT